jgi:hypothetical protein
MKNKRAQKEAIGTTITMVIVILVVAFAIYAMVSSSPLSFFKNLFSFNNSEPTNQSTDPNQQPSELQKQNLCVGFDQYWSDSEGKILNLAKPFAPGKYYIAISLPASSGDLSDSSNVCGDYEIRVERKAKTFKDSFVDQTYFYQLKDSDLVFEKEINGKSFYFIEEDLEDSGIGNGEYWFNIYSGRDSRKMVRASAIIKIESMGFVSNVKEGWKSFSSIFK